MVPVFINPTTGIGEDYLYQWDTGIEFSFYLDSIASVSVAMEYKTMDHAIVVPCTKGTDEGTWICKVPDIMLQASGVLKMFFTDVTNGSRVVDTAEVAVKERRRPVDYMPADSQDYINLISYVTQASALIGQLRSEISTFRTQTEGLVAWAQQYIDDELAKLRSEVEGR